MKRMAEKVAIAAFICISLIFVLICILTYFNLIPLGNDLVLEIDWALLVILIVIGVLWLVLAVYLLYVNFSQRMMLRYIMLYSDKQSSTKATSKVIKQLAVKESRQINGVRIRKIQITSNEHLGLNMKLIVDVANDDVAFSIDTLRYLLSDKYREVLGLEFAAMDFQIKKIKTNYTPDLGKAQAKAETLSNKRGKCSVSVSHFENSENDVGEISGDLAMPVSDDQPEQQQPEKVEIDEQTKQRLEEQKRNDFEEKLQNEPPRPMYGEPESPLTEDIVVTIGDEEYEMTKVEKPTEEDNEQTEQEDKTEQSDKDEQHSDKSKKKGKKSK